MMSRSTYNLKIDTISTYDIPLDRTFLKLSNGIRHVLPSTDRRLELKEKTSMAQTVWQPAVYAKGLISISGSVVMHSLMRLLNNTYFISKLYTLFSFSSCHCLDKCKISP